MMTTTFKKMETPWGTAQTEEEITKMRTLIQIQDKQIAQELGAIRKHGKNGNARKVIFAARTRATKAIMALGYSYQAAREAVTDAADMVALEMGAMGVDPVAQMSRGRR